MTIDEAIKSLTIFREQESALLGDEFAQSSGLGIEALKRFKRIQEDYPFAHTWTLPGETKD